MNISTEEKLNMLASELQYLRHKVMMHEERIKLLLQLCDRLEHKIEVKP